MIHRYLAVALLGFAMTIMSSAESYAMYDPGLGRFCSRDPIGFGDGEDLYASYLAISRVDPLGLCCICETEPDQCFLMYKELDKDFRGSFFGDEKDRWFYQRAFLSYYVAIGHKGGKETCGCHIIQDVLWLEQYLHPEAAKALTPEDFGKNSPDPGFYSFALPPWVTTIMLNDFDGSETKCVSGFAMFTDNPEFRRKNQVGPKDNRLTYFLFLATNRVKEAPSVTGWVTFGASWKWFDKDYVVKIKYWGKSSDNSISFGI